jgi:putative ABC transport system permease protein
MGALLQDVRYALRTLGKNPGFAFVAVLTLALGIGANTAIFSVVNAVLLRPLPFQNSSRLVRAWGNFSLSDVADVSPADFLVYRAQNHSFAGFEAILEGDSLSNLVGPENTEQVKAGVVTSGFFNTLGIQPALGRSFLPADEEVNTPQVAILGHRLWQERFASDPQIIGKSLQLDGTNVQIVGVLPRDLSLLSDASLWLPTPFQNEGMASRRSHFLRPIGLLKPGVTLAMAQSEMDTISARLAKEYPNEDTGWNLRFATLQTALVGDVRPALLVLLGVVSLVLLIACANVASLLLARNTSRRKEIAIRKALGASRTRLIRQMLTESILLGLAGGTAGILLAIEGLNLLRSLGPDYLPRLNEVNVSSSVLAFTVVVSILAGIIFGLAPALQSSRRDLTQSLKEGGATGDSKSRRRAHNVLVVAEVALSLVVLVASGLLLNSFWKLVHVRPGFDSSHVLTSQISLNPAHHKEDFQKLAFFTALQDRIQSFPGVISSGAISELPLSGQQNDTFFTIQERPPADPKDQDDADMRVISGAYLQTMQIPLLDGRAFSPQDSAAAPLVVLVNEPFARRFFPGGNPIGKHLKIYEGKPEYVSREIIGVVGGVKHLALSESPRAEMFFPYAQSPRDTMTLVVRSSGDAAALAPQIRSAVREISPDQAAAPFRTMDQIVSASTAGDRFNAFLLGAFGFTALLLTAAGIFGVLSYLVTQRAREIGLRMALGAQPRDVLRVIVGHGMRLALIGVAIGIAIALGVTRWMSSFLFDVKPTDPFTFAAVVALLVTTAFLACYLPARRAMRVDPMIVLRYE